RLRVCSYVAELGFTSFSAQSGAGPASIDPVEPVEPAGPVEPADATAPVPGSSVLSPPPLVVAPGTCPAEPVPDAISTAVAPPVVGAPAPVVIGPVPLGSPELDELDVEPSPPVGLLQPASASAHRRSEGRWFTGPPYHASSPLRRPLAALSQAMAPE